MTPIATALRDCRWSTATLAREAGVSVRTASSWMTGERPAPERIVIWLSTLAAHIRANPAPAKDG